MAGIKVTGRKPAKKETIGQRGKNAEKEVTSVLEEFNNLSAFAYERLPDARAAGGRIKAMICDFLVWHATRSILLEVKSVEHDYRLPKANLEQLPRLNKVEKAGGVGVVLVHFKTIDKWRVARTSFFEYGVPSWDMSGLAVFDTPKEALQSTGWFPI